MTRVLCVLLGVLLGSMAQAEPLNVAVAANFLSTAQALARDFEARTGDRVLLSSGSTGKLYAQIRQGAPYQIFLAADVERPQLLEQQGLTVPGSRFTYAKGKLGLWSRKRATLAAGIEALNDGSIARLAIANPKTAPYGRAARQTLQALGQWSRWRDRVVRGENVSQTLQFAVTGNVDAAFVALAQIHGLESAPEGGLWAVPESLYDPIEQQAVLLRRGGHRLPAQRFMAYLRSSEAQQLIEASGYGTAAH